MNEYSTSASLFNEMLLLEDIPSDSWTMGIVINCYCHLNLVDLGFSLLGRILKLGHRPHVVTYNTLLNGLCRMDRVLESVVLFNRMMKRKDFHPDAVEQEDLFSSSAPSKYLVLMDTILTRISASQVTNHVYVEGD